MNDVRDVLFGLFFEQYLAHELLLAGAKKFSFYERVFFIEGGEVHLELRSGCRSVDHELAFLLGAGDELFLGLRQAVRIRAREKTQQEKADG